MRPPRSSHIAGLVAIATFAAASGCTADEPADSSLVVTPAPDLPSPELPPPPSTDLQPPAASLDELIRPVQSDQAGTTVGGAQSQNVVNGGRTAPPRERLEDIVPQAMQRLVFQCEDDVTFAVRMTSYSLHVYPPNFRNGYLPLTQQRTESGVLYTASGVEFRSDGELATLRVGSERYVDCVANPAASVWEAEQQRRNLLE